MPNSRQEIGRWAEVRRYRITSFKNVKSRRNTKRLPRQDRQVQDRQVY